jgi:hypothetical protein
MEGLSMRPWIIVLSSAIFAVVVAAMTAVPELVNAPPAEIAPILLQHLPALAVVSLAVYALLAMLLVTAGMLAGVLRARQYLARDQRDRMVSVGTEGSGQLAPKLISALTRPGRVDAGTVLQTRFAPKEARNEIARLHYVSLARSHFFSAMIVLAGVIGLGLAQDHASVPFSSGTIPTISAILVFVGLVLLTLLGRIAIDVTAQPLLEAVSELPAERVEFDLLHRALEALERVSISGERAPTAPVQFPERLAAAVEDGHDAVVEAARRLSENTQALETLIRTSVETLETTIRASVDNRHSAFDIEAFSELKKAVKELTAVLQNMPAAPERAEQAIVAADPDASRRRVPPRLAGELRRLLQEIDAG